VLAGPLGSWSADPHVDSALLPEGLVHADRGAAASLLLLRCGLLLPSPRLVWLAWVVGPGLGLAVAGWWRRRLNAGGVGPNVFVLLPKGPADRFRDFRRQPECFR